MRNHVDTVYYRVGNCGMDIDHSAVIDPALRVICIHGLRIVNASIMPTLIRGSPNAPRHHDCQEGSGFYPLGTLMTDGCCSDA